MAIFFSAAPEGSRMSSGSIDPTDGCYEACSGTSKCRVMFNDAPFRMILTWNAVNLEVY